MTPAIVRREVPRAAADLARGGVDPVLARLYAARGVAAVDELDCSLARLPPPDGMMNLDRAGERLADAIVRRERVVVVADYDADGATACAIALRALAAMGADVRFVVPNRFEHGYGLTPPIIDIAASMGARLVVTVDNGIASVEGVAAAAARGIDVLITDHHLPGDTIPSPAIVVDPNQPGCAFVSRHVAGVGVMFYVLAATRAALRARGRGEESLPALAGLLDLVALGTIADVVRIDRVNRILVDQGLRRIRAGRAQPGLAALFAVAGRDPAQASVADLGYVAGPRVNAAGRLADMSIGIRLLATDDEREALALARELDRMNRERRDIEATIVDEALAGLDDWDATAAGRASVCAFRPTWHPGVVGIVASRIKDRVHRPVVVFAPGSDGEVRGSGRSIAGFHLRDALDLVSKRHPGLLRRFGGHAMAAGATLDPDSVDTFDQALQQVAREWLGADELLRTVSTDGPLPVEYYTADTVQRIDAQVWGQGFEVPVFCDEVEVLQQRLVADKHLKLRVRLAAAARASLAPREAIWFSHTEPLPARVRLAYRLSLDEFQGQQRLQMVVEAAVAA